MTKATARRLSSRAGRVYVPDMATQGVLPDRVAALLDAALVAELTVVDGGAGPSATR